MQRRHNPCMVAREEVPRKRSFLKEQLRPQLSERVPGFLPPWSIRAFVRLRWKSWSLVLLLLVGFAAQMVVIGIVYQLVDLTISLMEVWAELARKHLELTL